MRIWLQNFVSIQPRTSLEKSDVSWPAEVRAERAFRPAGELADERGASPTAGENSARNRRLQIFRRLVLGWIDSYDSNQILIFSGFSRSTKLSA